MWKKKNKKTYDNFSFVHEAYFYLSVRRILAAQQGNIIDKLLYSAVAMVAFEAVVFCGAFVAVQ
jgi:hypothetical protein